MKFYINPDSIDLVELDPKYNRLTVIFKSGREVFWDKSESLDIDVMYQEIVTTIKEAR